MTDIADIPEGGLLRAREDAQTALEPIIRTLSGLVESLMPADEAVRRFERGGPQSAREIERIYGELRSLEKSLFDIEDHVEGLFEAERFADGEETT
jgi:hypothetical protein